MAKKIFVADDEQDVLALVKVWLTKEGYDVTTATDGQQLLALTEQARPDLILLDYKMPGLTGEQVIQQIKQKDSLKGVPILMISASTEFIARQITERTLADDFLRKPFSLPQLMEKVRRFLG